MENERGSGSPWVFLGIGIAAVLVAHTLQGRDLVRATATNPKSHLMAVIGDTHRSSEASPFQRADMTAIAGDCTLDLSRATIPAGEEATIEVFALMGSISVRVPDGWTVDTRTMPVLAGSATSAYHPRQPVSPRSRRPGAPPRPARLRHDGQPVHPVVTP